MAGAFHGLLRSNHEFAGKVIFLADIFEKFLSRTPEQIKAARPWRGVRAGIVDCDVVLHGIGVGSGEALGHAQLFGVWKAVTVQPEVLIESHSIDD